MHNLKSILFFVIVLCSALWAGDEVYNLDYIQYQSCSYSAKTQQYCNDNEDPVKKTGTVQVVFSDDSLVTFEFTKEYTYRFKMNNIKKSTNSDGEEIAIVTGFSARGTKFMLVLGSDYFNLVNSKKWALYFLEEKKESTPKRNSLETGNFGKTTYSIVSMANCHFNKKTQKYDDNCEFTDLKRTVSIPITTKMRRDNLYLAIDTLPEISVSDVQKHTFDNGETALIYYGFDTEGDEVSVVIGKTYFNIVSNEEKLSFSETVYEEEGQTQNQTWTGSGVAITKDILLTNAHVINKMNELDIYLDDTRIPTTGFEVVGEFSEDILDLAIIRVKGARLDACPMSSEEPKLGEDVFVYGYPQIEYQGTDLKVTKGIVSGKKGFKGDESTFQIDAAIQHGNSGGPIVANGKVIGLATSFLKDSQNVNFGIKSSKIYHLLKAYGITPKPTTNDFSKCTYMLIGQ